MHTLPDLAGFDNLPKPAFALGNGLDVIAPTYASGYVPAPLAFLPVVGQGAKIIGGLRTHRDIKDTGKTSADDATLARWCGVSLRTYQRLFPKLVQYARHDGHKPTRAGKWTTITHVDREAVDKVWKPWAPLPRWCDKARWPWARQAVYGVLIFNSLYLTYGVPRPIEFTLAELRGVTNLDPSTVRAALAWMEGNGVLSRFHLGNCVRVVLDPEHLGRMVCTPPEPERKPRAGKPTGEAGALVREAEVLWEKGLGRGWKIVPDLIAVYRKRYKLTPKQQAVLRRFVATCEKELRA